MKRIALSIICTVFCISGFSQVIGGTINIYTPVTAINCNKVDVVSSSGFSVGERVLVIQMKGAVIDTSNTVNFGTINNYSNCGNFEFANVSTITGNSVFLQKALLNNYTISGYVQLIRVPQFINATVGSSLTCMPWNGTTGGVLVFEVSGTLTLNNNIDVSGRGFRGGTMCQNPDGNCGAGYQNYFYPVTSGFGAEKGEGIAMISASKNGGRGPLGNGGGGGNKHNSGGAGGGNFTKGGLGGKQASFCSSTLVGGIGGNDLNYSGDKLFMGGGGGCSDNNNFVGTPGTSGGGIVIISANTINGNSKSILSHGLNQVIIPNSIGDGSGGGGAGGAILMKVATYASAISLSANGGKGGGQNASYPSCFGPGGGGGTGIVCLSNSTMPSNVIVQTLPGLAGVDMYTSSSCYNTSFGATSGLSGLGLEYNAVIPENTSTSVINVDLGNDTTLTCGQGFTLNAGIPGAGYIWSTGATASTIAVSSPGSYWVTVSACGGTDTDTIQVSAVVNPITVDLGSDTTINCNQSLVLNSGFQGAGYVWSTGATTSSISISAPGQYWVNVTYCGATDSDTIIVSTVINPISIDLGSDTTIACNQSLALNSGFPGGVYVWSTGATTSSISISTPGQYWVNVTYCGATDSDTIIVSTVINPISIDLGSDTTIACNQSLVLNSGFPGGVYLWSTGATTSSISISTPGQYWVNVTYCGATDSDTIIVSTVINPISIDLGSDTTIACNQSLVLNSGFPGGVYVWSTGATTSSISISSPGQYWVNVTYCGATDSDTILVNAMTDPIAVDLGQDRDLECTQGITLDAGVPGAAYFWSTGSTSSSIFVSDSGLYWIDVTVCGTIVSDTILIYGEIGSDIDHEIPNVITPNGDAVNDTISFGSLNGPELKLTIYNRWGQKVVSESKRFIRWNAYFKNEVLSAGTYFWVIEYTNECLDNEKISKKGYITVIH